MFLETNEKAVDNARLIGKAFSAAVPLTVGIVGIVGASTGCVIM